MVKAAFAGLHFVLEEPAAWQAQSRCFLQSISSIIGVLWVRPLLEEASRFPAVAVLVVHYSFSLPRDLCSLSGPLSL